MMLYFLIVFFNFFFSNPHNQANAKSNAAQNRQDFYGIKVAVFSELTGNFKQKKVFKEMAVTLGSSGHFTVYDEKGKQRDSHKWVVYWDIEEPSVTRICINPKEIKIQTKNDTRVLSFSELSDDFSDQIVRLAQIVSFDKNQLEKSFKIEKKGMSLMLLPVDEKKTLFKNIVLSINQSGFVQEIKLNEKSGDEIQIQFSQLKVSDRSTKEKEFQCQVSS